MWDIHALATQPSWCCAPLPAYGPLVCSLPAQLEASWWLGGWWLVQPFVVAGIGASAMYVQTGKSCV